MKGTVTLLDSRLTPISSLVYDSPKHRKMIIDTWQKIYAKKYYTCALQFAPNVTTRMNEEDKVRSKNGDKYLCQPKLNNRSKQIKTHIGEYGF